VSTLYPKVGFDPFPGIHAVRLTFDFDRLPRWNHLIRTKVIGRDWTLRYETVDTELLTRCHFPEPQAANAIPLATCRLYRDGVEIIWFARDLRDSDLSIVWTLVDGHAHHP